MWQDSNLQNQNFKLLETQFFQKKTELGQRPPLSKAAKDVHRSLSVESCVDWKFWFIFNFQYSNISIFLFDFQYFSTVLEGFLPNWQKKFPFCFEWNTFVSSSKEEIDIFEGIPIYCWNSPLSICCLAPIWGTFITIKLTTWPLYGNCRGWILYKVSILMKIYLSLLLFGKYGDISIEIHSSQCKILVLAG